MKQHITVQQLAELSPKAHKRWRKWLESTGIYGQTHLMSNIGQMIEYLLEHKNSDMDWNLEQMSDSWYVGYKRIGRMELCGALWEAIKEILEK